MIAHPGRGAGTKGGETSARPILLWSPVTPKKQPQVMEKTKKIRRLRTRGKRGKRCDLMLGGGKDSTPFSFLRWKWGVLHRRFERRSRSTAALGGPGESLNQKGGAPLTSKA